jgi:Carboxypeptidase regulatory-like domain/TonB dependent receptor-like, beta-barrel
MKRMPKTAALLLIIVTLPVIAQHPGTATFGGRVMDPNGAVIDGAKVTARVKTIDVSRVVSTSGEGFFTIPNLQPGEYEVVVEASGFKKLIVPSVILEVGQSISRDLTLAVGQINEHEELVAGFAQVEATSSTVDGVINEKFTESLPLNGRNFLGLALLIPGNSPAPNFDPTKTNSVIISSAGQLGRGGNIQIDGLDNNDDAVGGPLTNITQEAVQEFQIATNRYSAEIGRSASSVINVVTKSGTNDLHGSISFFERDRIIQGLPATFDRSSGEVPPFDRQQYAGSIGGPFKENRAWWFGAIEYRNQDGAVLVGRRDVPRRTIVRTFAPAPLDDLLAIIRTDFRPSDRDHLSIRYTFEEAEDIGSSTLERSIGSETQRQSGKNEYHTLLANWTRTITPAVLNSFSFGVNNFVNTTRPVSPGPQLTFPSIQDGASFRVPQETRLNRFQFSDTLTLVRGAHTFRLGGELQRVDSSFNLGVFQQGRIELIEDFAGFDHNGDGRVDDNDLLFSVTLRSATPSRSLLLPDHDNHYLSFFFQDDWRVSPNLTLNLGLRYELDTDVKNLSGYDEINPLVRPFLKGDRKRDANNIAPRIGFNWSTRDGRTSIRGGYGIYFDRVTLEIASLERGLDGRSLAIEVRAGNVFFLDPETGRFPPFAPSLSNPFTGFILPGAGAAGIDIIDNSLQNPMVQQMSLGFQRELSRNFILRADYIHNFGTDFIIGRTVGTVFNPVVGGPDRVLNLEPSAKTKYDGLLLSVERRLNTRSQFRASYTLAKSFNYANDDQIPFLNGPVDSNNLALEYGPAPNDQRHRLTFSGVFELPWSFVVAPIYTLASGVPMDIRMPDASSRIPLIQRNAGGRIFKTGADLNVFINQVNANGGINGITLPLVRDDARFNDSFNSFDARLSRLFEKA